MFNSKKKKLFAVFLDKSYIWEKSCSLDIGQNTLSQSGCRIFKSSISQEQIDETASFLACSYKLKKIKSWLKTFWLGMVKNEFDQSRVWTLKLTVLQEWTDGINWFFACWYRFTKIKSWSKIYWVNMVKNGCGQSGLWSQDCEIDFISKMNRWNKLIFCMLVQIQEN